MFSRQEDTSSVGSYSSSSSSSSSSDEDEPESVSTSNNDNSVVHIEESDNMEVDSCIEQYSSSNSNTSGGNIFRRKRNIEKYVAPSPLQAVAQRGGNNPIRTPL